MNMNQTRYIDNYTDRNAIHVGLLRFDGQRGIIKRALEADYMKSERETFEFLLEQYKVSAELWTETLPIKSPQVLLFDGNFDIIDNHSGILQMFRAMTKWSGKDELFHTQKSLLKLHGTTVGYLKKVKNLYMTVVRNAGHMSAQDKPEAVQNIFKRFLYKQL